MQKPPFKKSKYVEVKGLETAPVIMEAEDEIRSQPRESLQSGLAKYTGSWTKKEVGHLLKRTTFGAKKTEITQGVSLGMDQLLDQLLTPNPDESEPINSYGDYIQDPDVGSGESWIGSPATDGQVEQFRIFSIKTWITRKYLSEGLSFHPKMTLFWHNLIPTQFFLADIACMSYAYYKVLDNGALGNFKNLVRNITTDTGMLLYLNGAQNVKEAPDENYARELQELFTVGKGSGSGYTENDVYEAARVLTGWTYDTDSILVEGRPRSRFAAENHDTGNKQFSAFYGNKVIEGKTGDDGKSETDELIDMIFDTPEVSKYICRRLYNFFVYHEVDATVEENIISPLAEIFRENNYDISPVLRALFSSEHFYDTANHGAIVKNPLDHLIGTLRTFDLQLSGTVEEQFQFLVTIYQISNQIGMGVGDPPSVAGWQAYHQQPNFDKLWINAETIVRRAQYQDAMIFAWLDIPRFISSLENPQDPNELITECADLLLGIPISSETISSLKVNLLAGRQTDDYWTTAWELYHSNPADETYRASVENRLKALFRQFMQLAEFQLT